MTHSGFARIDSNQLTTKMDLWYLIQIDYDSESFQNIYFDSNQLITQKLSRILVQIDSWLKNLSEILIRIKWWLNDSNQLDFVDLFGASTKFGWPFMGFHQIWPFLASLNFVDLFLGIPLKCLDSNHLMAQAYRRLESINSWLSSLPGIDSESTHDSSGFPRYWFRLTHDSECFLIFLFKSTHDSSEKHLILSRLLIRLWVIPMSARQRCVFSRYRLPSSYLQKN